MSRIPARLATLLLGLLAGLVLPLALPATAHAALPPTELLGDGPKPVPLKNAAMIKISDWGYRYQAGQQDSRLTVRWVDGKVVYRDRGTRELRDIPGTCARKRVDRGIKAVCSIPSRWQDGKTMFLEIWPRLGHDHVDGSSLPARFRMWVLGDRGRDVVRTGAGDDFVNGAQDADRVYGGAGHDWLRTGLENDYLAGGAGNDRLVGVEGADTIVAGDGSDQVGCGPGRDGAVIDRHDRMNDCEAVRRR